MNYILLFCLGVIVGGIVAKIFSRVKPSGVFMMDFSDPIKDVCTLHLDESLESVYKKKRIVLEVETHDYNSQE